MNDTTVDLWVGGDLMLEVHCRTGLAEFSDGTELGKKLMEWGDTFTDEDLMMESHVVQNGEIVRAVMNHDDVLPASYPVEVVFEKVYPPSQASEAVRTVASQLVGKLDAGELTDAAVDAEWLARQLRAIR